jgi:anti-sigma-K factor RskA
MTQKPNNGPDRIELDDELLSWLTQDKRKTLDLDSLDDEQRELEAAAALYALSTTDIEPMPAHLQDKLVALADQHLAPVAARPAATPKPVASSWWSSLRLAWGTAAFATVAALALGVRLASLPVAEAPPKLAELIGTRIPLQPGPDQAGQSVHGEVIWDAQRGGGYLKLAGLPVNDPQREQYQLWIFDGTRDERYPVDGGVFNIVRNGEAELWIRVPVPVRQAALFAVTVEKAGGTVVSDRGRIVAIAKPGA